MAKLIYSVIQSLDGYIEDAEGKFDWAEPDEQMHRFVNDLARPLGTHLYGRRMYETMMYWENAHALPGQEAFMVEFAEIWQAADKIVYSRTLDAVASARTRIQPEFNLETVRRMKATASSDIIVAGADLASQAIKGGLVDEYQFFVVPVVVGGGKRAMPGGVRQNLKLLAERRFGNGAVFLRYGAESPHG